MCTRPSRPIAILAVAVLVAVASAAARQPTDPAAPPAAPSDTSAPATTATPPAAPPTTGTPAGRAAPRALPKGRPTPSRDPAVLQADGRDPSGHIVTTSPALDVVPVSSVEFDDASARRDAVARDLADANHRLETATTAKADIDRNRLALAGLAQRNVVRTAKASAAARTADADYRSMAIARYVSGNSADQLPLPGETTDEALQRAHESRLAVEAQRVVERNADRLDDRVDALAAEAASLAEQDIAAATESASVESDLGDARADAERATADLVGLEQAVRDARPLTVVTGSDLPFIALDAYWRAANDLAATQPSCGLTWWALAGIGRVESNHGRAGGGAAGPDGRLSVPVLGIALDGTNGTRAIADTDKGAFDLDLVWDRAVGAMQFIPGTWKRYAEDQSGDGLADPHNVYDAALASARLLCTHGPGLDTADGLRRAYFAYNRSDAYVERVLGLALGYQQLPVPAGAPLPSGP